MIIDTSLGRIIKKATTGLGTQAWPLFSLGEGVFT